VIARTVLIAILALAAAAPPAGAATLVALGDSFSAGEGAEAYDPGTDRRGNRCHRSAHAWPRLLGVASSHLLACSGARTEQLRTGMENRDDRGQLPRLREIAARGAIDLVTITIGGNDIGFARHVAACFSPFRCLGDSEEIDDGLRDLRVDLERGYRAILRSAPAARLIVVGYPEITPTRGERDRCPTLGQVEKERAHRVALDLNRTIAAAASEVAAEFVSVRRVLDGHELCTREPWLRPVGTVLREDIQEMGHPKRSGYEAIAEAVRQRLLPAGLLGRPTGWLG
jgi:lysophospholipase L1-like esterase